MPRPQKPKPTTARAHRDDPDAQAGAEFITDLPDEVVAKYRDEVERGFATCLKKLTGRVDTSDSPRELTRVMAAFGSLLKAMNRRPVRGGGGTRRAALRGEVQQGGEGAAPSRAELLAGLRADLQALGPEVVYRELLANLFDHEPDSQRPVNPAAQPDSQRPGASHEVPDDAASVGASSA